MVYDSVVHDFLTFDPGPLGYRKKVCFFWGKMFHSAGENRSLQYGLENHFKVTDLVSKLPVSKASQNKQLVSTNMVAILASLSRQILAVLIGLLPRQGLKKVSCF